MAKFMEPDGDVFDPNAAPSHKWADMFRDIPLKWEQVPGKERGVVLWRPGGAGVLGHPTLPAHLARHVELCGFTYDPTAAKVRRIDPVRGGRSLTSPGIWQDATLPIPDADPVNEVVATAAEKVLSPAELRAAGEALIQQAEIQAG